MTQQKKILILGGTHESRLIADACYVKSLNSIYSIKGLTKKPSLPQIPYRIGGFGGVQGLYDFCREHHIKYIIDATHPFFCTNESSCPPGSTND